MTRNGRSSSSLSSGDGEAAAEGAAADKTTVLKKGPWTAAEDAILVEYVGRHGEGNWNSVQKNCGLARCGKSCRLRWANHLRPNLKKGSFTAEEEMLILQLHAQLGNKWARMAAQLPGRTDNEIKNFWNTRIKRRLRAGLPLYQTDLQIQQRKLRPPPPPASRGQFQFHTPSSSSSFSHHGIMMNNTNNNNMFHYNGYGSYGDAMNLSHSQLPSNQLLFNGGAAAAENGCRLLDALLHEAEPEHRSNGVDLKRERTAEMNPTQPAPDDISKLFDMISTPGMPAAPEWYNGGQPPAAADDELGLEMHQFASSMPGPAPPPADQEWSIGSCPWSNMPSIC